MADYKGDQTTGRPRKEINQSTFENLCKIQCTMKEISSVLEVCEDTLIDWCLRTYGESFSSVNKRFADGGKASLRRMMWKHAEKSASMCMFMAKNLLGYKDAGFEPNTMEDNCKMIAEALVKACSQKGGGNDNTNGKAEVSDK
jgi:hypothetical protein